MHLTCATAIHSNVLTKKPCFDFLNHSGQLIFFFVALQGCGKIENRFFFYFVVYMNSTCCSHFTFKLHFKKISKKYIKTAKSQCVASNLELHVLLNLALSCAR